LELAPDLKNKNELQKLPILIDYFKKYCPIRDESPFTRITSLRAVRYYGAYYLISSLNDNLEAQHKYIE